MCRWHIIVVFFFNDTATTEIYTLSLHDALPISTLKIGGVEKHQWRIETQKGQTRYGRGLGVTLNRMKAWQAATIPRSEEHTSELQSRLHLVCRLLLEKKIHSYSITTAAMTSATD